MRKIYYGLVVCLLCALLAGCGKAADNTTIRVGSLKGPTSIGLVSLMKMDEEGSSKADYEFTMEAGADTILAMMVKGELDIALVPANVASVLYNKTEGNISVIDINTLGVLYMVSGDESINSINDLQGRTVYLTGKGTTPDFVLHYLMGANGLDEQAVTLEYKAEATEVLEAISAETDAVGMLPQPFATAALIKNESLKTVIDCTKEWDALNNGSMLVTGVTVVRNDFLKEHEELVKTFMDEHQASAAFANDDPAAASLIVEEKGIIEKAPIAQKAIPLCNITYIAGDDMKNALEGYLQILADEDNTFVGGKVPAEDFYYIAK